MRYTGFSSALAAVGMTVAIAAAGCSTYSSSVAPLPAPPAQHFANPLDTTPTPTPTPIQLVQGTTVGVTTWPEGDTATGGQGQAVDGINCRSTLSSAYHHHTHLSIFVNGIQLAVPRGLGMLNPGTNSFVYHATCYYFIHTHDSTGILHEEAPSGTYAFTLGHFFDLWGRSLSNSQLAQFTGTVTVFVNGILDTTDTNVRAVPLNPGDDITLMINTTLNWIPAYLLPAGYPT